MKLHKKIQYFITSNTMHTIQSLTQEHITAVKISLKHWNKLQKLLFLYCWPDWLARQIMRQSCVCLRACACVPAGVCLSAGSEEETLPTPAPSSHCWELAPPSLDRWQVDQSQSRFPARQTAVESTSGPASHPVTQCPPFFVLLPFSVHSFWSSGHRGTRKTDGRGQSCLSVSTSVCLPPHPLLSISSCVFSSLHPATCKSALVPSPFYLKVLQVTLTYS